MTHFVWALRTRHWYAGLLLPLSDQHTPLPLDFSTTAANRKTSGHSRNENRKWTFLLAGLPVNLTSVFVDFRHCSDCYVGVFEFVTLDDVIFEFVVLKFG